MATRRTGTVAKEVAHQPVPASAQTIPDEDLAAIMAAISAMLGGEHHILNIEPTKQGGGWLVEGLHAQHQSYQPPRALTR